MCHKVNCKKNELVEYAFVTRSYITRENLQKFGETLPLQVEGRVTFVDISEDGRGEGVGSFLPGNKKCTSFSGINGC